MTPRNGDYGAYTMAVIRAGTLEEMTSLFKSSLPMGTAATVRNVALMVSQLTSLCLAKSAAKVGDLSRIRFVNYENLR